MAPRAQSPPHGTSAPRQPSPNMLPTAGRHSWPVRGLCQFSNTAWAAALACDSLSWLPALKAKSAPPWTGRQVCDFIYQV